MKKFIRYFADEMVCNFTLAVIVVAILGALLLSLAPFPGFVMSTVVIALGLARGDWFVHRVRRVMGLKSDGHLSSFNTKATS